MPRTAAVFSPAFRMRLRRFPLVHLPLAFINRTLLPGLVRLGAGLLRHAIPRRFWFAPPRGRFSDYRELKSGRGEGAIILEDQGNPKLPDPSIILLCKRTQHQQQPWPIFWRHYRNTRLVGKSLVHLNERRELSIDAVYGVPRLPLEPAWTYWPLKTPLPLDGPWTSVVNRWLPNNARSPYAHWLLDALPRLALLEHFPPETRVIVPAAMYKAQSESLEILGLKDRFRPTPETHLLIEDFYFSSPPSMIVSYSPYSVEAVRSLFLSRIPISSRGPKRFFVRRTSAGRNMVNEEEVLDFFRDLGWTIVDAAALKFSEQVQWFANAEAVCAIHGSGTANMVWCSSGCKFIEMFPADYLAGDQEWIAQCVQVDYHFMIFPCDYKLDAIIDLSALRDQLAKLNLL